MGAAIKFPPMYEEQMVSEFERGAHLYIKGGRLPERMLDWLALMQHYGVPTRLLDFTKSPYVACYFAFRYPGNAPYRAIWALDTESFVWGSAENWLLNAEVRQAVFGIMRSTRDTTLDIMDAIENDKIFRTLMQVSGWSGYNAILPVSGSFANERMMVQQGTFVLPTNLGAGFMHNVRASISKEIEPSDVTTSPLLKICIPNSVRMVVLKDLHLMNITEASLFPGLEGFARSLSPSLQADLDARLRLMEADIDSEDELPD